LLQPGQPGFSYRVNGVKQVIAAPHDARVAVGTAPVHVLRVGDHTYAYERVMSMMTTAYNGSYAMNGPSGAVAAWNGEPLHNGDVAVDPSVVPFGTYLYVPGYGVARAVDSGSDIIGDHIDLFFNESSQAVSQYGIQYKKIYVLGPISPADAPKPSS
jgi:3D (Asp-Asp-Asp) domain-containing protein